MNEMKRVLALLLCFVMLVGYVPANAFAAEAETAAPSVEETIATEPTDAAEVTTEAVQEETEELYVAEEEAGSTVFSLGNINMLASTDDNYVDAALFFSDLHVDKTEYNSNNYSPIDTVFGAIAAYSGLDFSTVNSVGDAYAVNGSTSSSTEKDDGTFFNSTTAGLTAAIEDALDDKTGFDMNYVWSDHDRKSDIPNESGLVYSGDNYYVYAISMADMSTDDRYKTKQFSSDAEVAQTIAEFTDLVNNTLDKTKPLFIVSHQPLLDRRNDNGRAAQWYPAINAAGEEMDIVFLFGHNHNYDQSSDYYWAKGETMGVEGISKPDPLTFTHVCAGYMNPTTSNSGTRKGTAVVAEIDEDAIYLTTYNSNGVYTGNYALNNQKVTRDHAAAPAPTVNTHSYEDDRTVVTATALGLTGVDVTYDERSFAQFGNNYSVAMDITLIGHKEGNEVTYTIQAEEDMEEGLSLFYVNGSTLEAVEFTTSVNEEGFRVLTFTTTKTGTFAYGVAVEIIPEDATLTELTISGPSKINYFLSKAQVNDEEVVYLDITGLEVTAVYTHEGKTYHKELAWDEFGEVADGYALSFGDLSEFGKKTVTVSYGGKEATFQVNVLNDKPEVSVGGQKISFAFEAADVTDVTVDAAAASEEIVAALEGLLTGNMMAYDINPTYAEGVTELTAPVAVTLPIPEGITSPMVYYVSDDYMTLEPMPTVKNSDGTATFTTTHFSTYVMGNARAAAAPETGWVTITAPTGGTTTSTYTLDTDGTIEANTKYLIVSANSGTANALTNNNGSAGSTSVSISGNTITLTDDSKIAWTFSTNNGGQVKNGSHALRLSSSGFLSTTANTMVVASKGNGGYTIQRQNDRYVNHNNGSWSRSTTASTLYLFKLTSSVHSGGTEGLYMALGGKLTYTVPRGTSQADVLAAVKASTSVWYHTGDQSAAMIYPNDVTWSITGYNANTPGEYTVTAKYNNVTLGTVKVIVPDKMIVDAQFTPDTVTVERDTSAATEIGTLTITFDNGDVEVVENLTLGMLEGLNLRKNGTYDAYYLYNGQEVPGITVKVVNKTGMNDYPAYPNPGSVDLNKTAAGLDFQNTGLARVELSTSGLPAERGVDVVIVIDTSSSMKKNAAGKEVGYTTAGSRYYIMRESLENMLLQFQSPNAVTGVIPDIDIAVIDFNGFRSTLGKDASLDGTNRTTADNAKVYTTGTNSAKKISDIAGGLTADYFMENTAMNVATIKAMFTGGASGTNYDGAFENVYDLLAAKQAANAAKGETREQYVIFMSDGASFRYNGFMTGDSGNRDRFDEWLSGIWTDEDALKTYITQKNYHAASANYAYLYNGNGTTHPHRMAEAIKGDPGRMYEVVLDSNVKDSDGDYLYSRRGLGAKIYSIGFCMQDDTVGTTTVTQATLEEVIQTLSSGEGYYVKNVTTEEALTNAFANIVSQISLAASNARFVDQMGSAFELQMNPVQWSNDSKNGVVSNSTDITITARPVYTEHDYEAGNCTVDKIGQPYGDVTPMETVSFTYNNNGTPNNPADDTLTKVTSSAKGTENILVGDVICAKYFFYNTSSEIKTITLADGSTYDLPGETFYWNIGIINEQQFTLSYTVYLSGALDEGAPAADSYPTNNFAILYYDNYVGNEVSQSVPSPVLAWEGAHVSYAFYLVDSSGKPVYKDGSIAPNFYTAYKVTQPVVYSTVELNQNVNVIAGPLAQDVLPEGYTLYAPNVSYEVGVASGSGQGANYSYWEITNGQGATYVTGYGSATDYTNKVSVTTNPDSENYVTGYDFTNTTVWFPVVWVPSTIPDAVVIDFGIPVDIHVLDNDQFGNNGTLTGLCTVDATKGLKLENGQSVTLDTLNKLLVDVKNKLTTATTLTSTYGAAEIVNGEVRYTPSTMAMNSFDRFVYEVEYAVGKVLGYYYGTVTVIPATTVYYEDSFLELKGYNKDKSENNSVWSQIGTNMNGIQDEDRPGYYSLSSVDANNIYGYDSAYTACSVYSQGSAAKAHVDSNTYATASFSFYGTGFDVISLTSNTTGVLKVDVDGRTTAVDTYYGYTKVDGEWVVNNDAANSLYQIPVIKVAGLDYGMHTVTLTVAYYSQLDHNTNADGYDFYLDAIRVYDPANNGADNSTIENAYKADGEGWPIYQEFRNLLIKAAELQNAESLPGMVFIDGSSGTLSLAEYKSYGPNNEIYLAKNQSVSFSVTVNSSSNIADVQVAMKSAHGGTVTARLDVNGNAASAQIGTASDLYYSIGSYLNKNTTSTITFTNTGDGILSLTNLKITFTQAPPAGAKVENYVFTTAGTAGAAIARLRAAMAEAEIPEITVPEENEPEETLDANLQVNIRDKSVKIGSSVVVKVTTNSNVDALTVNGKQITHYTENRRTGVRTWTINVKAEEAGDLEILVTAYSAAGQVLEIAREQITVIGKKANAVEEIVGTIIGVLLR